MSATHAKITFGVLVEDIERWHSESVQACHEDNHDGMHYEWVVTQITETMRLAGQQFIDDHPDLFRGELV